MLGVKDDLKQFKAMDWHVIFLKLKFYVDVYLDVGSHWNKIRKEILQTQCPTTFEENDRYIIINPELINGRLLWLVAFLIEHITMEQHTYKKMTI